MKGIDLTGRVAVITGGARGIGRATAESLRDAGAKVAIGDIDTVHAEHTGKKLGIYGGYLDVTDPYTVAGFHGTVEERLGPVEIWINNAGIMPVGPILDQDDAIIARAVQINLLGVINGSRVAARAMAARGHGRIVNIASVAGRVPAPGMAVYNGTKFGIVGFGEALDAELAARGVRVSTVFPSFAATELIDGLQSTRGMEPVPPQEIAAAVVSVLRRGHRSAVVPAQLGLTTAAWIHLPRPVARWLSHRTGMDQVFLTADDRRRSYDSRIHKGPAT
ncbi:MAG: putative short chain dehydrogenase [Nocardia sp.]|uniref:SDR family oxidoreductase n=1 Tax=Nocardia sp. TaxID=1821 RepID=UPI0026068453|nr:SDR family oxidoreductase [Nocardia sp.]MCU1641352.1 putative short chain dehydrogenase [Nocardia sp.]